MATTVEVITSPDCIKSSKAVRIAMEAASGLTGILLYQVNTISESGRQYAQSLDVKSTPAFVVNGKLAYEGVPKKEKMREMLLAKLVS